MRAEEVAMRKWMFVLMLLAGAGIARAQEPARIPLIYVSGEAQLEAPPDLVIINLGVVTQAKTVGEARTQNAERMDAVAGAIKRLGVPPAQIATTRFSVTPQYDYQERRSPPRILGYSVSNQLTVRQEDLDKVSEVLDAALQAGANDVGSVTFTLKEPGKLKLAAYEEAVRDAQSRAQALARAAGVQLGKIYVLRESGGMPVPVRSEFRMMAMAESADQKATPMEPGEVNVQVRVEIQYEIKQ
jgi:uncharacterized protein YggE